MDERPLFADKAYTKDGPEAATDNSFKKERRTYRVNKKMKPSMTLVKSKRAYRSKWRGKTKGAPRLFGSRDPMIELSNTNERRKIWHPRDKKMIL